MERQMSSSHGTFYWNELCARDVAGAKKFYADTMGWSYEAMPMSGGGTYWVAKMNNEPVGGVFDISGHDFDGMPECWMSYIAVDDVDERVRKAIKAGAKLIKPVFDVPGIGRIAILKEPGGAGIGWITPVN
jgi:predicted enzyme related to lactoylglutathione lyase